MNKTHRVVWSESRGAFIVAHEYAASGGKRSTTRSVIAQSIAAAAFCIVTAPVFGATVMVDAATNQKTLGAGETLVITNTGVITATGGASGVSGATTAAGVTNSGTILGSGGGSGIDLNGGTITGGVTNSGTSSLVNGSVGMSLENNASVTSVVNEGTINATGNGYTVHITQSSVATLTNSGTASVIGGANTGIRLDTGGSVGVLNNSGTIVGIGSEGIVVDGGTIGVLNNTGASAVIHGRSTGLGLIGGSVGSIANTGTMSGGLYGIYVSNATLSSVSNSGLISGNNTQGADAYGIYAGSGALITSVINSGTIVGSNAAITVSGTISSVTNSGMMIGQSNGIYVDGSGAAIGSIVNSGSIAGVNRYGIEVYAGSIASIINSGTITARYSGIYIDQGSVGQIVNSGLISADSGIYMYRGTLGSLINSGTLMGSYSGFEGGSSTITNGITNSGVIMGTRSDSGGIELYAMSVSGGITNLAGGIISGASGIEAYTSTIDFISNQRGASISGITNGIAFYGSSITGGISNSGTITGGKYGINLGLPPASSGGSALVTNISGGIANSGLISGTSVAGILLDGSTVSGISNLSGGTISGGQFGIDIRYTVQTSSGVTSTPTMLSGGIVNSGLISGTSVAGIAVNNVSISGGITNLAGGTITGGATGISVTNASTVSGGLSNSGVISGGTYSVYVDPTSSLGAITIGGVNTAQFIGDVYALASDVTVSSGSVFSATNAFDVNSFNVAAGATVNLSDPASTAGGASGITVANGFSNAGTVSVAQGVTGVINGAYTQASSGTYKLGASSVSDYGVLAVNGTVDLPSAAKIYVDVASDSTLTNKQVLHGVITSTGLTASTFDVTDNLDLVSFTGVIDGNNVDLVTKVNALVLADVLANGNYNAAPAAKVIDEIIATNSNGPFAPVIDELAKLQTSQQVSRTVSEFLPLLSGASNVAAIGTMWELDQVIQSRLDGNPGLSSGDDYLSDRGAWVKPFGTWGNQSDQGSAPGFTSNTGGIVLGADGAVSKETRLGLAFAYASSDITGKGAEASDENKVDMYQVVGYGSYALDPVTEVNFQLDGGGNSNSGHRSIPAFGTNANSSYNSSAAHFGVGLGRNLPIDDQTMWTPSVRVDYTWVRSDSYGETGAGPLNLNVQSASAEQLLTSVDAKVVHKINDYSSVFGNVGVGYDSLARNNTQIISAFAGAPGLPFATEGVGLKPWTVLAGFGVVATPQGGPEITIRYDLQDRSSFTEQSFSVKARWAF